MTIDQILKKASKYKKKGANIIDLGCLPDTKFKHLEKTIYALKKNMVTNYMKIIIYQME